MKIITIKKHEKYDKIEEFDTNEIKIYDSRVEFHGYWVSLQSQRICITLNGFISKKFVSILLKKEAMISLDDKNVEVSN